MAYKTTGGFIYFVQAQPDGLIKIGWSITPRKRFRTLQAGSPVALVLLGVIHGTLIAEREEHDRFAHLRDHDEWFLPGEALVWHIKKNASMVPIMTKAEKLEAAKERGEFRASIVCLGRSVSANPSP